MKKRIELIDGARGIAVILMVCHHFLYDMVEFLGAPPWLFSNSIFSVLQLFFAGLFIFLCGVSSHFSRSNVKRGARTALAAAAVSLATYFIDLPVLFGILHLLAVCMLFYGIAGRAIEKIPRKLALPLWIALILASNYLVTNVTVSASYLWPLGWTPPGFFSSDYFPLFPWIFVFLLGTWAGKPIRENRLPLWFYDTKVPFFPHVGRHSFIIYLAHQPLLYGITMLILHLRGT